MAEAIGARHAVVVLQAMMLLGLGRVLVLRVLLVVVQQAGHPASRPIQPGVVALLMVLGVHEGVVYLARGPACGGGGGDGCGGGPAVSSP